MVSLPNLGSDEPSPTVPPVRALVTFPEILRRFADQRVVTISTGTTCAYLGDERNLREFLVADEAARQLREAGHLVHSLLFDDSLDPLNPRQLRVAVNKDPAMIEAWTPYCGKPISEIPDPWGCCDSFAAHFEQELMARLARFGAHPTLISTARLYERGAYRPYVEQVLMNHGEILRFLKATFPNYSPKKLFQPICPDCGFIDSTEIIQPGPETTFACLRCERIFETTPQEIRGKLSWKLDHAAKWAMYSVDAEPFSLAYLEPREGSFVVARALGREFFGALPVSPLRYGLVTMPKELGGKLSESLPARAVRSLMIEGWKSELNITAERIKLEASRHHVSPGMTFTDAVKQLVPMWLLKPGSLSAHEREIVSAGASFARHFGASPLEVKFPTSKAFDAESPDLLARAGALLGAIHRLRERHGADEAAFDADAKTEIERLGERSKEVVCCVRRLVGQEKGVPTRRLLFHLPADYLGLLGHAAALAAKANVPTHAVVGVTSPAMVTA